MSDEPSSEERTEENYSEESIVSSDKALDRMINEALDIQIKLTSCKKKLNVSENPYEKEELEQQMNFFRNELMDLQTNIKNEKENEKEEEIKGLKLRAIDIQKELSMKKKDLSGTLEEAERSIIENRILELSNNLVDLQNDIRDRM